MTTRDEILAMARGAGLIQFLTPPGTNEWHGLEDAIVRLVRLAQAAAYDRAAKVCDCYTLDDDGQNDDARRCARAIRAIKEQA